MRGNELFHKYGMSQLKMNVRPLNGVIIHCNSLSVGIAATNLHLISILFQTNTKYEVF